jgi:hypothetical protein
MASSILTDFVTKRGLVVLGTNYVTSSTNSTGTLQVNGGAAIAKNLIVGTTATIGGSVTINGPTTLTNGLLVLNTATFRDNVSIGGDLSVNGTLTFDQISVSYLLRAGSLAVTTISTFSGTATFNSNVLIDGATTITQSLSVGGKFSVLDATTATLAGDGSIITNGGIYIGDNLIVASTLTSSVNTLSNSIYTLGGIGIARDLDVGGDVVISGNLRVLGTQTIIDSTSTAIQDPIIDIGTGPGNSPLGGPDGYNKGIVIHYHDMGDNHMFIGRSDLTGRLVVRDNIDGGVVDIPNQDYTTQGSYSGFDIGNIKVWDTTNSTGTNTGALVVSGGVGIAKDLHVGETIYGNLTGIATKANNLTGGAGGSIVYQSNTDSTTFLPIGELGLVLLSNGSTPYWGAVTGVTVDYASTASNIRYGSPGSIPYQIDAGITGFTSNLIWNSSTDRLSVSNVSITSGVNSTGTTYGALIVNGGVGIGQDVWIGGKLNVAGTITSPNTATFDSIVVTNTGTGITVNNINVSGSSTFNTIIINGLTTVGNLTGGDTTVTNLTVLGGTHLNTLTVTGPANFNTISANTATFTNLSATNFTLLGTFSPPSLYVVGTSTLHNTLIDGTLEVTSATTLDSTLDVLNTATFNGLVRILNTTNSISSSSGALVVDGGVGIRKDLWVGGNAYINGQLAVTTSTINQFANQTIITAGTDTAINTSTGNITIWNTSNLQSVTSRGATTNQAISITNATGSLSTTQGALIVTGGVGIGQNLYVGGITNLQAVTATNLIVANSATIGGNIYANTLYSNNQLVVTTATAGLFVNDATPILSGKVYGYTTSTSFYHGDIVDVTNESTGYGPNWSMNSGKTIHCQTEIGELAYAIIGNKIVNGMRVLAKLRNTDAFNFWSTYVPGIYDLGVVTNVHNSGLPPGPYTGASTWEVTVSDPDNVQLFLYNNDLNLYELFFTNAVFGGNTYLGYNAGGSVTSGQGNTLLGYQAGYSVTTGSNLIVIGEGAEPSSPTAVNETTLGNTSTTLTRIQGVVYVSNTTSAINTTSGALQVVGGVGVQGDLYARNIFDNGSRVVTQATLGAYGLSSLTAGTDTAVNTSTGAVTIWNTSTFQSITSRTPTTNIAIGVTNTTESTSTNSGALTVTGGVGIGGNLYVGGEIVAQKLTIEYTTVTTTLVVTDDVITTKNTTESTSTTSGALVVAGGVGIGGALYVGTSSYIDGSLILTTATVNLYASKTIISAGTDTAVNTSTGNVTIWNTSTLQSITNRGATTDNIIHFTNNTASTSTTTGAVLVDGGIGVKDSVYVGNRVGFTSRVYQYYNPITDSLDTVFQ